jgi:hypothetical protein
MSYLEKNIVIRASGIGVTIYMAYVKENGLIQPKGGSRI